MKTRGLFAVVVVVGQADPPLALLGATIVSSFRLGASKVSNDSRAGTLYGKFTNVCSVCFVGK